MVVKLIYRYRYGIKVVSLYFEIADPAITLSCFYAAVSQKILDGDQIRISVEQLGGHGVAQLVAEFKNR